MFVLQNIDLHISMTLQNIAQPYITVYYYSLTLPSPALNKFNAVTIFVTVHLHCRFSSIFLQKQTPTGQPCIIVPYAVQPFKGTVVCLDFEHATHEVWVKCLDAKLD